MNEDVLPEKTHCWVPIVDLTGCEEPLKVPIELTQATQAELQATMDPRIFMDLIKNYVPITPELKRLKPHILKRNPTV